MSIYNLLPAHEILSDALVFDVSNQLIGVCDVELYNIGKITQAEISSFNVVSLNTPATISSMYIDISNAPTVFRPKATMVCGMIGMHDSSTNNVKDSNIQVESSTNRIRYTSIGTAYSNGATLVPYNNINSHTITYYNTH